MDRVEATGLSIAVIGHLFLLALLTLGLFNFTADPPSTDAIDVSFVEDVGLTSASPEPVQAPAPAMAP